MQALPDNDNDFMAGFNGDDDAGAAGVAGAAGAGGNNADVAQAGTGTGDAGAAAGSAGAAGQGADGAASSGDTFAAGLSGAENPNGQNSSVQGVDTAQNGEQGRGESQALDLSTLPESVRQRLEEADRFKAQVEQLDGSLAAARRDYQALHGRVAPLQQQLAALQQSGAQSAQQQVTQQQDAGTAQAGETLADADAAIAEAEAYFDTPEFKRYAEQWPDEARVQRDTQMRTLKAVRTMRQQLEQQVGAVSRTVQQEVVPHLNEVRHERAENARERELSALDTAHPDWRALNTSPEFGQWLQRQKPLLNFRDEAHMRERLNDGEYVATLLTSYKESKGITTGGQQQQIQQDTANLQQQGNAGGQQQQQTSGASARLAMSGGPDKTGVAVIKRPDATGVTAGDDFIAGFNSADQPP